MLHVPECIIAYSPIRAKHKFRQVMQTTRVLESYCLKSIVTADISNSSELIILEEMPKSLRKDQNKCVYLHVILDVLAELYSHLEQRKLILSNLDIWWVNASLLAELSFGPPWSKEDHETNLRVLRSLMSKWATFESVEHRLSSTGFFLPGWREWGTRIAQLCSQCDMPLQKHKEILTLPNCQERAAISEWLTSFPVD